MLMAPARPTAEGDNINAPTAAALLSSRTTEGASWVPLCGTICVQKYNAKNVCCCMSLPVIVIVFFVTVHMLVQTWSQMCS